MAQEWGSNSHAGSLGPKNSGSLYKATYMSSKLLSLSASTRYEEIGNHKCDQSYSTWLWAAERRPTTWLASLAPDLISIGGISRLSLVLQANKPKIVHGVSVQVMLLVRVATPPGKSRLQQAMIRRAVHCRITSIVSQTMPQTHTNAPGLLWCKYPW